MVISEKGIDLIKEFEGFRANAYQDVVGVWTIGYGSTRVNGVPVKKGDVITKEDAEAELRKVAQNFFDQVVKYLPNDLSQNKIDAIASFIYNVGVGAFKKSTLLKCIQSNDEVCAGQQFIRWNKAGGKIIPGLTRRRAAERELFLYG